MNEGSAVRVCVDAMGGDHAPDAILAGIGPALDVDPGLHVLLTGPADVIEPFAAAHAGRVEALVTSQVIEMDEHPAQAVRSKRDSSIVVGCRLVKEGRADAFFSAGSTGAAMAAATLVMGRLTGIARPALAAVFPTTGEPLVFLDVGANADCKPENLLQSAHMGSAYASVVLGRSAPRISLLNIGEEPTKGSQLALEAHELMARGVPGFVGNLEANHLLDGLTDVVVTDGFTGNVVLKLLEGSSRTLLSQVREALAATTLSKFGALFAKERLTALKRRLDPEAYGGAPLLGVDGVCIIGHGNSSPVAVQAALEVAARAVRGGLVDSIASRVANGLGASVHAAKIAGSQDPVTPEG